MKLHQRIQNILEEKKLRLIDLHRKIKSIFAEETISYRTLQRIIAGHTEGNGQTLHQISMGLDVPLRDLYKGTTKDLSRLRYTPRNEPQGKYSYSPNAYAEILTGPNLNFIALHFVLKSGAKTRIEKDPEGEIKYTKWIYVQKGKVVCTVEGKKYILKKGDSMHFDSSLPHCFENNSAKTTNCILIQNPRHI